MKVYIKAIELDREDAETYFALGFAYNRLKKYDESAIVYLGGIDLDEKNANAHFYLGYAYIQL